MARWAISLSPTKFTTENGLVTDPKQMADMLNEYFCSKIQNICNELENRTLSDPLILFRENFNRWTGKQNVEIFELKEVTPKRVRKLFKMLQNSGSEDLNGISNKILKISIEALILPITHLVNQCIRMKK